MPQGRQMPQVWISSMYGFTNLVSVLVFLVGCGWLCFVLQNGQICLSHLEAKRDTTMIHLKNKRQVCHS